MGIQHPERRQTLPWKYNSEDKDRCSGAAVEQLLLSDRWCVVKGPESKVKRLMLDAKEEVSEEGCERRSLCHTTSNKLTLGQSVGLL